MRTFFTVMMFFSVTSVSAKEIVVESGATCFTYNEVWESERLHDIDLRYDTDRDIYYLYIDIGLTIRGVAMMFDTSSVEKLRYVFNKYLDWNKKAIENQVEITKDIALLELQPLFRWGDEWHISRYYLGCRFGSLTTNKHILAIVGTLESITNKLKESSIGLMFTQSDVERISKWITPQQLSAYRVKAEKQLSIEAMFK